MLQNIFENHLDRYSGKWKHYFEVYDRYLQKYINQEISLLEIGISNGGSLQIWKKYLGSKARIFGIDVDPRTMFSEPQIKTYCGSQVDVNFLNNVLNDIGTPDIIIDDGSHDQLDILNSFGFLWPRLNNNGVYIVEDIHTAYSHEYHGGITNPINFVSVTSKFAHDVNVNWIHEPYTLGILDLKSLSFYDSLVVLEKEKIQKKQPVSAGANKIPGV